MNPEGTPSLRDGLEHLESARFVAAARSREARARLSSTADEVFGPGPEDRLLHATFDLAHLDEEADPATAPQRLNVSRATFYRRLAVATELLAAPRGDQLSQAAGCITEAAARPRSPACGSPS